LHIFITISLGIIASLWAIQSLRAAIGMRKLPRVERFEPLPAEECPKISIIFGALNEAAKLPSSLPTMLALDYPDYELIAVDDRSTDDTGSILDEFAARNPRLKVVHIAELPPGWLGKPHALHTGSKIATASWLVFTDADVHFAPDSLRRIAAVAIEQKLDHLALMTKMIMLGFWEHVVMTFFGLGFALGEEAWRTSDPRSSRYIGIGAFQLIRREAYDAFEGHRGMQMEVLEDMKLSKLTKRAGFRSQVGYAPQHVSVRWQAGIGNLVRGSSKTFFAAASYNLAMVGGQILGLLVLSVFPWVALPFVHGDARIFAAIAVAISFACHATVSYSAGASPLYGFTHPIGALIFSWMLARSAFLTLKSGGVTWRGTFYPLADLRRGLV
jgi:cellulose synthase/poly-beta-1,6-N-acetylglucosamine synthase-like glycosyltransferase